MKSINHNYNNAYTLPNESTVIRGTIEMKPKEYAKVIIYLQNEYAKAQKKVDTSKRDGLYCALHTHRQKYMILNINHFCLGITATKLIFKKYNLPRYKNQNYAIKIIK